MIDFTKDIVRFSVLEATRLTAKKRDEESPEYNKSSLGNKGRFYSFLGEHCIADNKLLDAIHVDTFSCDFTWHGRKLDIKAKRRRDFPQPYFDALIDGSAINQKTLIYLFLQFIDNKSSLLDLPIDEIRNYPYKLGYIVGWISKKEFLERARFFKKGTRDNSNGHIYKNDAYVVPYCDLYPFEQMKQYDEKQRLKVA